MAPTTSGSVASYKDRLSRIASEVLGDAEELEIPQGASAGSAEDSPASARRSSRRSARPAPSISSPVANGAELESLDEITKYKQDIKKLQASEAEIKALSFNYAALLKEKEEQLSRLREENGSLKKKMDAKRTVTHEPRDGSKEIMPIGSNVLKGTVDQSPSRSTKQASQANTNSSGNHAMKGNASRQGGFSNGAVQSFQHDAVNRKIELRSATSPGNGEEQTNMLEENNKSLLAAHARHDSDIKLLKAELDRERENAMGVTLKLQEEQRLNESSQRELQVLKRDKENISIETQELRNKLNEKISELRGLQVESSKMNIEESNRSLEDMKNMIRTLEKENTDLKTERDKLEVNLKLSMKSTPEKRDYDDMDRPNRKSNLVIEEMALSVKKLEDTLRTTCNERDKALQEVARLKQHLLEKELADSDKMDEDDRTIEELTANFEKQKAQIFYLEKALRREAAKKEEINKLKDDETKRLSEIIDGLNKKLADCMKTVDLKNDELLNLQTALGQYYAEMDAKDRLRSDLAMAREELAKYSEFVQAANQKMEVLKREKEDIAAKLAQAERMLSESKYSIQKLEDDNSKLRTVLERSMTTLNRMSLDSDNYVDRRIVIKLLVTYFQRNHSKEVLDLMVRMLGFSEEEKKRIGVAQHAAGKGVVRGVLGLPGRFVGGILGGSSPETSSHTASENQSFADLWVDFLVKETEERERRESSQSARTSSAAQDKGADANTRASSLNQGSRFANIPTLSTADLLANQTVSFHAKQNQSSERSDSEFATVPLSPAVPPPESSYWRKPPRY